MINTMRYASPLGNMVLAERDGTLVGIWFERQKYFFPSLREGACENATPLLNRIKAWLDSYFAGEKPPVIDLPLSPEGSTFQQTVWQILLEIPYGGLTTYGAVAAEAARRLGKEKMSAQAVGGAVGHNPISIIIPCHRVVGANGSLTGYAAGIERKLFLLAHEGADVKRLHMPKKGTAL